MFRNSSDDLLQLVQFLLEGLDLPLALNIKFEFVTKSLQLIFEPKFIELPLQHLDELLTSLTVDLLVLNQLAIQNDVVDENREVVLVLGLLVASLKICREETRGLKLGRVISELHLAIY